VASDGTFLEPGVENTGQEDEPAPLTTPTNKQTAAPMVVQPIDVDPRKPLGFWLIMSIIIGFIILVFITCRLFRYFHTKRKEGFLALRTVEADSPQTNLAPGGRHSFFEESNVEASR
jgi:hypothetical protein